MKSENKLAWKTFIVHDISEFNNLLAKLFLFTQSKQHYS